MFFPKHKKSLKHLFQKFLIRNKKVKQKIHNSQIILLHFYVFPKPVFLHEISYLNNINIQNQLFHQSTMSIRVQMLTLYHKEYHIQILNSEHEHHTFHNILKPFWVSYYHYFPKYHKQSKQTSYLLQSQIHDGYSEIRPRIQSAKYCDCKYGTKNYLCMSNIIKIHTKVMFLH